MRQSIMLASGVFLATVAVAASGALGRGHLPVESAGGWQYLAIEAIDARAEACLLELSGLRCESLVDPTPTRPGPTETVGDRSARTVAVRVAQLGNEGWEVVGDVRSFRHQGQQALLLRRRMVSTE